MFGTNKRFILKYGTSVEIDRLSANLVAQTKAIIGVSKKSLSNMDYLEGYMDGIFMPDYDIQSGDIVRNLNNNDRFVTTGIHKEFNRDRNTENIAFLLHCNQVINVSSESQDGDVRGNLKTIFTELYTNVPVYLQEITNKLRQFDAGLLPDTVYKVYTTKLNVSVEDMVSFINDPNTRFRVIATNFVTFPNMVVMQIARDVRK